MPQGYRLSKRRKQAIRRDIRAGQLCTAEIARKHGVCGDTVRRYGEEIGILPPLSHYEALNQWAHQGPNPVQERREREKRLMGIRSQVRAERVIAREQMALLGLTRWYRAGVGELVG